MPHNLTIEDEVGNALERDRRRQALLLRGIYADIEDFVLPKVPAEEGDARERLLFMLRVLRRMADDRDWVPDIADEATRGFEAGIERHMDAADDGRRQALRDSRSISVPLERIMALRAIAASLIADRAKDPASVSDLAGLDRRWCAMLDQSPDMRPAAPSPTRHSVYDKVTSASVSSYLRATFTDEPDICAKSVTILPGGRSKKTIMIEVSHSERLPGSLIMRQQDSGHIGTVLTDEYAVLNAIDRSGVAIPLPTPLHFERNETALGGTFLLMRRLPGDVMGDYERFHIRSEQALDDLAVALARLHALDPAAIGLPDAAPGEDCGMRLRRANDRAWARWREHAVEPSPLVEYAFAWIDEQSHRLDFPAGCVHGDIRPHNLLASADGLTGILDWELCHLGDPAEDLAYLRPTVEKLGLWERFVATYRSAGGSAPDENRLRLHAAAGSVRNASFSAVSAHLHISGQVQDFVRGATGYYSLPLMERQLVEILEGVLPQDSLVA